MLTLDEALELGEPKSEEVTIATAGVTRGVRLQAEGAFFPVRVSSAGANYCPGRK